MKEERLLILENWIKHEEICEDEKMMKMLNERKPEKIKKRRPVDMDSMNVDYTYNQNPEDIGWEEYYDYIFPDDFETKKELKIISKALQWYRDKPGEAGKVEDNQTKEDN